MRLPSLPERDEAGSLALELSIAFPALLLLVMFSIQYGLVQHGRHVALAVAQRAAREGRAYAPAASIGDRRSDAVSEGRALLTSLGGSILSHGDVTLTPSPDGRSVDVVVTGEVTGPFGAQKVTEHASGPIERIQPAAGP